MIDLVERLRKAAPLFGYPFRADVELAADRIVELEARLERKDEALTEIANSGVRVHTGFNWIATMAEQALGEQE